MTHTARSSSFNAINKQETIGSGFPENPRKSSYVIPRYIMHVESSYVIPRYIMHVESITLLTNMSR